MRAGFGGGQMPLAMRLPKLRGNTSRDRDAGRPAFRTYNQPVNIRDLDRFEAGEEVTPETLKAKGLIRSVRKDVKLLGVGELSKKLTVSVHGASATAPREGRGRRRLHAHCAAQGAQDQEGQEAPRGVRACR